MAREAKATRAFLYANFLSSSAPPQFPPTRGMVRHGARHERPDARRMVELAEMTQLVHHDIVLQALGQEEHPEVETERPLARTAPPHGPLVPYADIPVAEAVGCVRVEPRNALEDGRKRPFLVTCIIGGSHAHKESGAPGIPPGDEIELCLNPPRVVADEAFGNGHGPRPPRAGGNGEYDLAVTADSEPHPARTRAPAEGVCGGAGRKSKREGFLHDSKKNSAKPKQG